MTFDVSPHPAGEGPCRAGDSQPRPPRVTGTSFCLSRCSSFPDGSFTGSQHTPLRMESIKSQQRQLPCDISPERINSSSRSSEWFSLDSPSSRDLGAEFPAPHQWVSTAELGAQAMGSLSPRCPPHPGHPQGLPGLGAQLEPSCVPEPRAGLTNPEYLIFPL